MARNIHEDPRFTQDVHGKWRLTDYGADEFSGSLSRTHFQRSDEPAIGQPLEDHWYFQRPTGPFALVINLRRLFNAARNISARQ